MQQTNSSPKYKTRHNKVGKIIHGELFKRLRCDHNDSLAEFVLENEIYKITISGYSFWRFWIWYFFLLFL